MSNNTLWMYDTEADEALLVGKSFGSGWSWRQNSEAIENWLRERDIPAGYGIPPDGTPTELTLLTEDDQRIRRLLRINRDSPQLEHGVLVGFAKAIAGP